MTLNFKRRRIASKSCFSCQRASLFLVQTIRIQYDGPLISMKLLTRRIRWKSPPFLNGFWACAIVSGHTRVYEISMRSVLSGLHAIFFFAAVPEVDCSKILHPCCGQRTFCLTCVHARLHSAGVLLMATIRNPVNDFFKDIFEKTDIPSIKKQKTEMRAQKATQSRMSFCKILVIVCVGFAMKCSCGLLPSSLSSGRARVHLDLVSLWASTRLTHQVAASQRNHFSVKTERRKARRQRVGGSRACGCAPCLDAWARHSALQRGGRGAGACVMQQVVCVNFRFDFSLFKTDVK